MLPAGLACIWAGGGVWAASLAAVSAGLGAEFAVLAGLSLRTPAGAALPVCLLAVSATAFWHPADAAMVLLLAAICAGLMARGPDAGLGTLWIGAACVSLIALRRHADGLGEMLFVMTVVWCGDIGAYLAGRLVGGPRLAPSLSPGKTWSGSAGGLACSVAAGVAVCLLAGSGGHPVRAALLACLLGVVAQAGDLLESAVKRRYGRKIRAGSSRDMAACSTGWTACWPRHRRRWHCASQTPRRVWDFGHKGGGQ